MNHNERLKIDKRNMQIVKEFKRESGITYQLTVQVSHIGYCSNTARWQAILRERQPRKRKWTLSYDMNSYAYRSLSLEEQNQFEIKEILKIITQEELLQAVDEVLELFKEEFKKQFTL